MVGRTCFHCKQWVGEGEKHDCWTTTEAVLTQDLSEDLRDAWERLRETAVSFGGQRIYASHKSIMFSRKSCYFFVPHAQGSASATGDRASKSKLAHVIQVRHRDEVEEPLTGWLREAYEWSDAPAKAGSQPRRNRNENVAGRITSKRR